MTKTKLCAAIRISCFENSNFGFVSVFEFRASDFGCRKVIDKMLKNIIIGVFTMSELGPHLSIQCGAFFIEGYNT
ncbi:MAG: hypothetical protein C4530_06530 [Desulfobacteraceae bacterium]|nr:MAG: hypothetical protein C4530_06530 [Desulfobacteraceae bacterium]